MTNFFHHLIFSSQNIMFRDKINSSPIFLIVFFLPYSVMKYFVTNFILVFLNCQFQWIRLRNILSLIVFLFFNFPILMDLVTNYFNTNFCAYLDFNLLVTKHFITNHINMYFPLNYTAHSYNLFQSHS